MMLRLVSWAVLPLAFLAGSTFASCPCHERYCDFDEIVSQRRISCYLPGRSQSSSAILNTNTASECTLDDLFARNEIDGPNSQNSCPKIGLKNVKLEVYLEPCEEITFLGSSIKTIMTEIRNPLLATRKWGNLENCTSKIHDVQKAMFTGSSTQDYNGGISLYPASRFVTNYKEKTKAPFKANIVRENIQEDGTCNIAIVSMPETTLSYLRLDNTPCLQRVFSNSVNADDFKNALQDFGPDQLGIIRITSFFEDFLPTDFELSYLDLATWKPYRTEYPGRALISVDSLRNKKYPPDPINIGTKARFDAIFDEHSVPVIVPFSGATEVVDGKFICPKNGVEKCGPFAGLDSNGKPAILCSNFTNTSQCNGDETVKADIECPDPNLYEGTPIFLQGVLTAKCIDKRDIRASGSCPDDQVFDVRLQSCTSTKSNRINSRPIDIVLWDFQGDVFFGQHFDSTNGRIITVLVYGDIDTTNVGVLKGSGEVFEDFFDKKTKAAFRLPDPGLCLLDGRDFVRPVFHIFLLSFTYLCIHNVQYDVAQDEFGCFDKKQPKCKTINLSRDLWIAASVMAVVLGLYHHYETRKQRKIGCRIVSDRD